MTKLINGFAVTLELFALTLLFAIPLGLIICFGSMSKFKPLKAIVKIFVWQLGGGSGKCKPDYRMACNMEGYGQNGFRCHNVLD